MAPDLPDFESLPPVSGQPQGNAWGLWGKDDELGTLNLLTPDVVLEASKEIRTGQSVQLDLPLDFFNTPYAGRASFKHEIIDYKNPNPGNLDFYGHDDILHFNTQSSSQWDGLRHVGSQRLHTYYNNLEHKAIKPNKDGKLGTHRWVERGGIVGRGVLLDYARWREETGQGPADTMTKLAITVQELEQIAAHQHVTFKTGDVLIIRTGFIAWYIRASPEERAEAMRRGEFAGVEPCMDMVKWLWNHHFAAVAGDANGFETCPVNLGIPDKVFLHEWLLHHWGCPIGELWDLEKLSDMCQSRRQWSFFFSSAPLHVFGGVGSPPNALAIF